MSRKGKDMAKTFTQMAEEAMAEVPGISPAEAHKRAQDDPNTLLIAVLDLADRRAGQPVGSIPISAGMLPVRADQGTGLRDERLADRSQPIITICGTGQLSACSAKTLKEMGFTNVSYVEGGTVAWAQAGLPLEKPTDG